MRRTLVTAALSATALLGPLIPELPIPLPSVPIVQPSVTPSPSPSPDISILPNPDPGLHNQTATANFVPGETDGLHAVSGSITFLQQGTGQITVSGSVSNLQPNTVYVTVPYVDGGCIPAAGITAFPSSSFTTDAQGHAEFTGTVNPNAINPLGRFYVRDTHSVSIRQVIVNGVQVPGLPIGTPNIPNVGAVEACDHSPEVSNT